MTLLLSISTQQQEIKRSYVSKNDESNLNLTSDYVIICRCNRVGLYTGRFVIFLMKYFYVFTITCSYFQHSTCLSDVSGVEAPSKMKKAPH